MKNSRPLIVGAGLIVVIGLLVLLLSQQTVGPKPTGTPVTPIKGSTPVKGSTPFVVTSESVAAFTLPTLTPTPQATPVPTKPRPGYTPVPDNVISPIVVDQSPQPGEEARPDGSIRLIFDRAMDHAAVESAFQVYPAVKGAFNWKDDRTVVFTPAEKLARAGIYYVVFDH